MDPQLHRALVKGDIKTLESLISLGVDIKQRLLPQGYTALHIAAGSGQIEMFEHLLGKKYFDVKDKRDNANDLSTPLHIAVAHGELGMVKHLLKNNYYQITDKAVDGQTLYIVAASRGQTAMLDYLLEHNYSKTTEKDDHGNTALLMAIVGGQLEMVKYLLAKKYSQITETNNWNSNALATAAYYNQIGILEYLLKEKYFKIDEKNEQGVNVFNIAVAKGNIAMVDHLLSKKYFQATTETIQDMTALHLAGYYNQKDMIEYLLNIPEVSLQERTRTDFQDALRVFAAKGNLNEIVILLLKQGTYVDKILPDGRKVSEHIAESPNTASLPLLQASEKLLQLAQGNDIPESAESLIDTLGEGLNARQIKEGNTALHLAIMNKQYPLVKLLLEKGANILMPNDDNITPIQLIQTEIIEDPSIVVLGDIQNISQIEKMHDKLKALNKMRNKEAAAIEEVKRKDEVVKNRNEEVKSRGEVEQLKTLETKEKADVAGTTIIPDIKQLEKQLDVSLKQINENIEKLPKNEQESSSFRIGKIFANPHSPVFNPVVAYQFLDRISDPKFPQIKDVHGMMADLLISGNVVFRDHGLDAEPEPIARSDAENPEKPENETTIAFRLRAIIEHLLQADSVQEEALRNYITEYTLGSEKSLGGTIKGITGKNVTSQMAIIDSLRDKELENKRLQEQIKKIEAEKRMLEQELAELRKLKLEKEEGASPVVLFAQSLQSKENILDDRADLVITNKPMPKV